MKIIIPYRENSERCKNKNTRIFFADKSLLEITTEHLKNHDIFFACIPSKSASDRANTLNVKQINLSDNTASGNWSDLAVEIAENIVDKTEPIAFMFCTNPVFFRFNNIENILKTSIEHLKNKESAIVVYPFKHYVLDEKMMAVNHGQGSWHKYSQYIPQWYINPWLLNVTTANAVIKYKYWYTPDVAHIVASGPCVDIDTEEDFQIAKIIYTSTPKTNEFNKAF